MPKMIRIVPLIACFLSLNFCAAFAQPQSLPPQTNNPAVKAAAQACANDITKFCPTVIPGGGRIVRCLISNRNSVSKVCLKSMVEAKAALGH
jgi:hypothetical protein